jgi:hypothetical protein
MRKLAVAVTATVALGLAAGAEARTIKSTVELTGGGYGSGFASAHGNILSKRSDCLSGRVVRITSVVDLKHVPLRTDVSSLNGYWGGDGVSDPADAFQARMKPKRISKRKRCSGDRDEYFLPRAQPRTTFPSQIQYFQLAYAGGQVGGAGNIESVRRCLARRKVKVFDFDDDERGAKLRASDVSSRNGWWGAFGDSSSEGVNLTLAKKRLGPGKLCGGESYSYDPDPNP